MPAHREGMISCPYPGCDTITKSHEPNSEALRLHRELARKESGPVQSMVEGHEKIMGELSKSHSQGDFNKEDFFEDFEEDPDATKDDLIGEYGEDGVRELIANGYYVDKFSYDRDYIDAYRELAKNGDPKHFRVLERMYDKEVQEAIASRGADPRILDDMDKYFRENGEKTNLVGKSSEYFAKLPKNREDLTHDEEVFVGYLSHHPSSAVRGNVVRLMHDADLTRMVYGDRKNFREIEGYITDRTRQVALRERSRRELQTGVPIHKALPPEEWDYLSGASRPAPPRWEEVAQQQAPQWGAPQPGDQQAWNQPNYQQAPPPQTQPQRQGGIRGFFSRIFGGR